MRYEALARENGELRGLREALPPVADRWLPAEIVTVQLNGLRQRLLLNRGASNGVFKGQAVLDDKGLIGQTDPRRAPGAPKSSSSPIRSMPCRCASSARACAPSPSAPVTPTSLALPYLPANADIRNGDLLVTSGLGGVFPAGLPGGARDRGAP